MRRLHPSPGHTAHPHAKQPWATTGRTHVEPSHACTRSAPSACSLMFDPHSDSHPSCTCIARCQVQKRRVHGGVGSVRPIEVSVQCRCVQLLNSQYAKGNTQRCTALHSAQPYNLPQSSNTPYTSDTKLSSHAGQSGVSRFICPSSR